ncbi:MAG: hypothetical protein ABII00_05215 [Elusimicrobiota bacterium]
MPRHEWAKRHAAATLCAALTLSAPGPCVYEACAAQIAGALNAGAGQAGFASGAAAGAGALVPGSISAPLGDVYSAPKALRSGLPAASAVDVTISPVGAPAKAARPAAPAANAAPKGVRHGAPAGVDAGRIGKPLLERRAGAEQAPGEFLRVLRRRMRAGPASSAAPASNSPGGRSAETPERWLTPSAETLGSASASKEWGRRSFAALRGENTGASRGPAATVDARSVRASASVRRFSSLRPAPAAKAAPVEDAPTVRVDDAPVRTASAAKKLPSLMSKESLIPAAASIGVFLLLKLGVGAGMLAPVATTWPVLLSVNLVVGIGVRIGLKLWKKRQAGNEEKGDDAPADLSPVTLEPAAAAERLAALPKGKKPAEVSVFDFGYAGFRSLPVTDELIEQVRAGLYSVTTDDTGVFYLVPATAS